MLAECLDVFESQWNIKKEPVILDSYIPADGTYVVVKKDGDIKGILSVKMNKKSGEIDRSHWMFSQVCFYDYHCRLLEMNKPMDPGKVIHSNNYLSFSIKKENIRSGKLTVEAIKGYYGILAEPLKKYKKSRSGTLYQDFEEKNGPVDMKRLEKNQQWIVEHIFHMEEYGVPMEDKDYLKIFFEEDKDLFLLEEKRYILPNLYNSNEYNVKVKGEILGIPNNNLGMNTKKPFLSVKTRKTPASYLLNGEAALKQKVFFDYLFNFASAGKYNVFVDRDRKEFMSFRNGEMPRKSFSGIYLRIQKGKNEAEIIHQDVIPYYRFHLEKEFAFRNIVGAEHKLHPDWLGGYKNAITRMDMEGMINEVLFSKCLVNNYFTLAEKLSINDGYLKQCLLLSRETVFNWLYKGEPVRIASVLDWVSLGMVKGSLLDGYYEKAIRQFNFRYSLKEFFQGGKDMAAENKQLFEGLMEKIQNEEVQEFSSDSEYYFGVGQLVNYFISLSKSGKKNQSLANPFFNAKRSEEIKRKLQQFYKKYNYEIQHSSKRFNALYSMVLGYQPEKEDGIDQDRLIEGYVTKNVIYTKEEK